MVTVKCRCFIVSQFHLTHDACQQVAQLYPAFRFHCGGQNVAHLGLKCITVVLHPDSDGSMYLFRHIPDRYCFHIYKLLLIVLESIAQIAFRYIRHP